METESRRERKKREMRERILAAALARFSRDGFEATSLRTLADDLDVSVPTLRNYFGSKDGLLVATLDRLVDAVDAGMRTIVERRITDPDEALQLALAANATAAPLSRNLLAHVARVAATEPAVKRSLDRLRSCLEAGVLFSQREAGGRRDVEPERLAQMLADLIYGSMVDWVQSPDVDPKTQAELILRIAFEMVNPPAASHISSAEEQLEALPPPPPAAPARATRSELPNKIYEVARRRFAEDGVRETSLDAIADELSISPLTIFYHFGSKDGLIAQMNVEVADVIEASVQTALADGDDVDLRKGIAVIPVRVDELPPFGRKLTAEMLRVMVTHEDATAASRRVHGQMAQLVAEGQRRGLVRTDHGPMVLARIVLDFSYASLLRWVQDTSMKRWDVAHDAMRSIQIFLAGPPPRDTTPH